jgi:hypothetical protein
VEDNEIAADFLQQVTVSSYENNCPLWTTRGTRKVPWWSPQLGRLCGGVGRFVPIIMVVERADATGMLGLLQILVSYSESHCIVLCIS